MSSKIPVDINITNLLIESPTIMKYCLLVPTRAYFTLSMFYICTVTWLLRSPLGPWLSEVHVFSFTKRRLD